MLQVFSIDVYSLHDPCDTLSFITNIVDKMFDVLPIILIEPFSVTTQWVTTLRLEESLRVFLHFCPLKLHGWIW